MTKKIEFIVASDVSGGRDGIGVEAYDSGELILEVFRDDTQKRRYVTLFKKEVDLDLVEDCIQRFKDRQLWEFLD